MTLGEIDDLLVRVKQEFGTTRVIVTQHPGRAPHRDMLVFLHQGEGARTGSAEQLKRSPHAIVRSSESDG